MVNLSTLIVIEYFLILNLRIRQKTFIAEAKKNVYFPWEVSNWKEEERDVFLTDILTLEGFIKTIFIIFFLLCLQIIIRYSISIP